MSGQTLLLSSISSYGTEQTQSTSTIKRLIKQLWTSYKFKKNFNKTFTFSQRLFCLNLQFQYTGKSLKWNLKPYFNDDIHYKEQQTDELYSLCDPTWNADPIATEANVWGQGQGGWVFKECQDVQHKYKDIAASGVKKKTVFLQRHQQISSWKFLNADYFFPFSNLKVYSYLTNVYM